MLGVGHRIFCIHCMASWITSTALHVLRIVWRIACASLAVRVMLHGWYRFALHQILLFTKERCCSILPCAKTYVIIMVLAGSLPSDLKLVHRKHWRLTHGIKMQLPIGCSRAVPTCPRCLPCAAPPQTGHQPTHPQANQVCHLTFQR